MLAEIFRPITKWVGLWQASVQPDCNPTSTADGRAIQKYYSHFLTPSIGDLQWRTGIHLPFSLLASFLIMHVYSVFPLEVMHILNMEMVWKTDGCCISGASTWNLGESPLLSGGVGLCFSLNQGRSPHIVRIQRLFIFW